MTVCAFAAIRYEHDTDGLSPIDYVARIRPWLTPENVDEAYASMPPHVQNFFERFAESCVDQNARWIRVGNGKPEPERVDLREFLAAWWQKRTTRSG